LYINFKQGREGKMEEKSLPEKNFVVENGEVRVVFSSEEVQTYTDEDDLVAQLEEKLEEAGLSSLDPQTEEKFREWAGRWIEIINEEMLDIEEDGWSEDD